MGKYSEFIYGSGVLYGPTTGLTSISPETGPTTGGTNYTVIGTGFYTDTYNDDFTGVTLDLLKWTSLDSGTGSLTTSNPNLTLSTGTTSGSYSGVQTVNTFTSAQFKIKPYLGPLTSYPVSTVELLSYVLYVDSSNYCKMSVTVGPTSGSVNLSCSVYVGGVEVDSYDHGSWSLGYSTFKIARFGSKVYFSANGSQIFNSRKFVPTAAYYQIYSYNDSASYDASARVSYFTEKTYAMFGVYQMDEEPTVVSDSRIRGLTPPSLDLRGQETAFQGTVDVYIVNSNSTSMSSDIFEYYYLDKLKLVSSSRNGLAFSMVDDDQVVTPDNKSKGI